MNYVLTWCMTIIGALVLDAIAIIWSGFVFMTLWGWFVVPAFGLPGLGFLTSIGLLLVVGFATKQYVETTNDKWSERIAYMFMKPSLALVIGVIVHQFM